MHNNQIINNYYQQQCANRARKQLLRQATNFLQGMYFIILAVKN